MSRFSSSKRLQNDIATHEENSDRRIVSDMYYIIFIELSDEQKNTSDTSSVVKTWLATRNEHRALAAYVYKNELYLLFSSVEGKEHYLKGSHQALCSEYASIATLQFGCKVSVRIIEIESRTRILVYFQTKIFENTKKSVICLSKNSITKKEVSQLTLGEVVQILQERSSVIWDKISPTERFGIFYKYSIESGKEKFITMSEMINIQDMDKYTSYFFE